MIGKYADDLAKWLMEDCLPDDQVGSSGEGLGWAGEYQFDGFTIILREDPQGFVTYTPHIEDSSVAWEETCKELDLSRSEPTEGDYVVESLVNGGYAVSPMGAVFVDYDVALAAIGQVMDSESFWPDVWLLSDHGNFQLLNLPAELERIKKERT